MNFLKPLKVKKSRRGKLFIQSKDFETDMLTLAILVNYFYSLPRVFRQKYVEPDTISNKCNFPFFKKSVLSYALFFYQF